jgi:hypothetical protein
MFLDFDLAVHLRHSAKIISTFLQISTMGSAVARR